MQHSLPLQPRSDSVKSTEWLFAHYVIARKIANLERTALLKAVSEHFNTKLYTPNPTPELPQIYNMGSVDYQRQMPYVFKNSAINLNISLRSIRSGIPLRCFDIMGCGGFLLSNYQGDFYEHFIPGEDLVLFDSQEDFLNKCDYYLKHDNERLQITANGYLGAFHSQVTVIPEGSDVHEMLGWIMPRLNDFSTSHSYFSWMMGKKKEYVLDARVKGGERHMIMSNEYDHVLPMDILPEYLIKAIIAGDIDRMEALGIYEVAPEDFALCEFVCSSKMELQRIVRDGLDMLRREMC